MKQTGRIVLIPPLQIIAIFLHSNAWSELASRWRRCGFRHARKFTSGPEVIWARKSRSEERNSLTIARRITTETLCVWRTMAWRPRTFQHRVEWPCVVVTGHVKHTGGTQSAAAKTACVNALATAVLPEPASAFEQPVAGGAAHASPMAVHSAERAKCHIYSRLNWSIIENSSSETQPTSHHHHVCSSPL